MFLCHCMLCPVDTVQNQFSKERISHRIPALDKMFSRFVNQNQIVTTVVLHPDVNVFAEFYISCLLYTSVS